MLQNLKNVTEMYLGYEIEITEGSVLSVRVHRRVRGQGLVHVGLGQRVRTILVRRGSGDATPTFQVFAEQRHARESLAASGARIFLHVRVRLEMRS